MTTMGLIRAGALIVATCVLSPRAGAEDAPVPAHAEKIEVTGSHASYYDARARFVHFSVRYAFK